MTKWTSKVSSLGRLCACVFSPCPHSIPHSIPHCSHIIIIFCLIHCQKSVVSICLHIYSLTQCLGQFLQIAVLTHWCLILCICASYAVAKKKKKRQIFETVAQTHAAAEGEGKELQTLLCRWNTFKLGSMNCMTVKGTSTSWKSPYLCQASLELGAGPLVHTRSVLSRLSIFHPLLFIVILCLIHCQKKEWCICMSAVKNIVLLTR